MIFGYYRWLKSILWGYWENILRIFINCKDLKPKDSIKNVFIIPINKKIYDGNGDCVDGPSNDRASCQNYKHISSGNKFSIFIYVILIKICALIFVKNVPII